jgi:hypothetical protein
MNRPVQIPLGVAIFLPEPVSVLGWQIKPLSSDIDVMTKMARKRGCQKNSTG